MILELKDELFSNTTKTLTCHWNTKNQKPEIIDQAPTGKIYLDGNVAVSLASSSIKER